jgi:hypothetical protein
MSNLISAFNASYIQYNRGSRGDWSYAHSSWSVKGRSIAALAGVIPPLCAVDRFPVEAPCYKCCRRARECQLQLVGWSHEERAAFSVSLSCREPLLSASGAVTLWLKALSNYLLVVFKVCVVFKWLWKFYLSIVFI